MKNQLAAVSMAAAMFVAAAGANAETVTVYSGTTWFEQSPGGTSDITTDAPRSGNGSLRVEGPRSRYATGTIFPNAASVSLGLLSSLTAFGVDVRTDNAGTALSTSLPTVRLHLFDPTNTFRSELIWENAEVNTITTPIPGAWYSVNIFDNAAAWRFVNTGAVENGRTAVVGSPASTRSQSIADWVANISPVAGPSGVAGTQPLYSADTFIGGISIGIGGGAVGYIGYADNLRIAFAGGSDTTYNFEATRATALPEPASLALVASALLAMGILGRRRDS